MHQDLTQNIAARFVFVEDRANEFLDTVEFQTEDGQITEHQPTITEMEFSTIEELMEVLSQFEGAIEDCVANVNGKTVSLAEITKNGGEL